MRIPIEFSSRNPSTGIWSEYGSNPIFSPTGTEDNIGFGSVWIDESTYHMFYFYNDSSDIAQIGHATSSDGITWTRDTANNPIMTKSASGWDGENVNVPRVWKEGSTWYMIYRGYASATGYRLGLATAIEPGGPWTKSASNPILTGTEAWELYGGKSYIDQGDVIKVGSTYYMQYTSCGGIYERSTGMAYSDDLTTWTKYASNPIFTNGYFNAGLFKYGDHYYMATPKYRIDDIPPFTRIELWRSLSPLFTNREMVRTIAMCDEADSGAWNYRSLDTPSILTDDIYRDSFPDDKIMMYISGSDTDHYWRMGLIEEDDIASALSFV